MRRLERRVTDFVVQALAEVAGHLLGKRVDREESDDTPRSNHHRGKHAPKAPS
jgi:hypothetical protein